MPWNTRKDHYEIGEVVYKHGVPQRPGRVIGPPRLVQSANPSDPFKVYPIICVDGWLKFRQMEWVDNQIAGTLDSLIDDHEKKLEGHRARRQRLIDQTESMCVELRTKDGQR